MNVKFQEETVSSYYHLPRFNRYVAKATGGAIRDRQQTDIILIVLSVLMFAFSFLYGFSHTKYAYPSTKDHQQEEREHLNNYIKSTGSISS